MTQEMIAKRLQIISDLKEELNNLKANYEEMLEEDVQYQELQEVVEKTRDETREKKEKVLANPSYKAFADRIKEIRRDIRDNKEVLSQELVDYYRKEGVTEIEDHEGNVKRMKFSVRLIN